MCNNKENCEIFSRSHLANLPDNTCEIIIYSVLDS